MAHEIETHDHVVLHREAAWHGLGTIVQDAPTPMEALQLARLDWMVEQWPLYATDGEGNRITVEDKVANVRSDTKTVLGIVGTGWTPLQNKDTAEFCEALAEQNDTVKVESAGSIRNGKKVWFLLKGESFSVRDADEVCPYILVSNGSDGGTGFRCTPTTIRVVCANTLHMVIPSWESEGHLGSLSQASFSCKHTGNLKGRIEEAKNALQLYGKSLGGHRATIDSLAAKDISTNDIQKFFLECYTRDFGAIPVTPISKVDRSRRDRSVKAYNAILARFGKEETICGANAWTMFNAYSGWLQNDRKPRGKDAARNADNRMNSNLFGSSADKTLAAFETALAI